MPKLIVNADDFGYSRGINHGIIDSYLNGIVNSATMMMNMSGTDHAIELAKQYPTLKVGVHLVLTCGRPLLNDVPSLVDEKGNFKSLSMLTEKMDIDLKELEREWTAQIGRFVQAGLKPNHLDSHHHVHGMKELYPVVKLLSEKYELPVRKTAEPFNLTSYSDIFLDDFYGEQINVNYFKELENKWKDSDYTIEIMTHPGYLDEEVLKGSSYNVQRTKETKILTSVTLPKYFELV